MDTRSSLKILRGQGFMNTITKNPTTLKILCPFSRWPAVLEGLNWLVSEQTAIPIFPQGRNVFEQKYRLYQHILQKGALTLVNLNFDLEFFSLHCVPESRKLSAKVFKLLAWIFMLIQLPLRPKRNTYLSGPWELGVPWVHVHPLILAACYDPAYFKSILAVF